jgi:acetylornithine aminotransferase/acetylornithine/N-succinyldiaminopimelate aminotransferase
MNADTTGTTELYDRHVMKNYGRQPLNLARGLGARVWDEAGRAYLDFCSGIAVTALGHCHPRWVAAVREQAGALAHASNLYRNANQGRLARRLVAKAGPGRVLFCNSGAEANEALIKLARLHGARKAGAEGKCFKILCANNAFHGRTFGGMSATPQEKIQRGFRPMLPGFAFAEFNNLPSFEALADAETCAVFIETIQGESGVTPATDAFLRGLRELCDRRDLLLLLDEVQCGVGRTGRFFAFEHAGIRPDAIGMAKGLGGGFPIGAVWASSERGCDELFQPGMHGTTFGGSPLACAAALAVLETIDAENLLEAVTDNSAAWHAALRALKDEFPGKIADIRGRGYMVGVQLIGDLAAFVARLRDGGLLVPVAGGNVIRLLPPLTATPAELACSVEILRAALRP